MRLSLRKGAYAVLSGAAWQEIRVRSGRDDKFIAPERLNCRSLGCPGFPVKIGGVANSMRFSLQKTAHAALASAASRKSGYARDDKGEGGASIWCDGSNDSLTDLVHTFPNLPQASQLLLMNNGRRDAQPPKSPVPKGRPELQTCPNWGLEPRDKSGLTPDSGAQIALTAGPSTSLPRISCRTWWLRQTSCAFPY